MVSSVLWNLLPIPFVVVINGYGKQNVMSEIQTQEQKRTSDTPGRFACRKVYDGGQAAVAVASHDFSVPETDPEGYDPYDHAPPPPNSPEV